MTTTPEELLRQAREALAYFQKYATGNRQGHCYKGDCPDDSQPTSRDPGCPACEAMDKAAATLEAIDAHLKQPSAPAVAWHMRVIGCDGSADWCELGAGHPEAPPGIEALPLVYSQPSAPAWPCHCDERGIGKPGETCGDCPRDYGHTVASAPSGEPAEFIGRVIVGHARHHGGWCVFEETAPDEFVAIKGPFATRPEADAAMRDGTPQAAPAPQAATASTAAAAPEPVGALAPLERQEWMRVHAQAVGELRAAQDIITRHHISAPDVLALTGGTMPAAHPAPAVAAIVRQLTESEVTELLSRRDWRDENLRELIAETAQVCATAWGVKLAATEEQQ